MLIKELSKSGNGKLYLLYQDDYDNKSKIGQNLSHYIDPIIINFTFNEVRIYKDEKMRTFLDAEIKKRSLIGLFTYFSYHKAFIDCSLLLKIVDRSSDNTILRCTYNNSNKALLTINERNVLLELQNLENETTKYTMYHGAVDTFELKNKSI